jgi:hypothetical protein
MISQVAPPSPHLILGRYLVEWEGYEPEWEAWRISGNVGDPVATWEPGATVMNTTAMEAWAEGQ